MLERNVGGIDQLIRFIVGLILILAGLAYRWWLGLLGLILIGTAVFGRCSLYYPLNISTREKEVDSEA